MRRIVYSWDESDIVGFFIKDSIGYDLDASHVIRRADENRSFYPDMLHEFLGLQHIDVGLLHIRPTEIRSNAGRYLFGSFLVDLFFTLSGIQNFACVWDDQEIGPTFIDQMVGLFLPGLKICTAKCYNRVCHPWRCTIKQVFGH